MARPKVKPEFEEKDLGKNPFKINLVIPITTFVKENQFKVNGEGYKLPVEAELERTRYMRVIVSSERRLRIAALASCSRDLLFWILYTIERNKDYLWINKNRYMQEYNVSLNTYKKALKELIKENFLIITVVKDVYWLNPNYFFPGNRVAKYPENVEVMYSYDTDLKQQSKKKKSAFNTTNI